MTSLRSTKDLRNIVHSSRKITFSQTFNNEISDQLDLSKEAIAETEEVSEESDEEIASSNTRADRKTHGHASYGTGQKDSQIQAKFQKQLELSQNDKTVIEQLQKKVCMQKLEYDELQRKYNRLERLHDKLIHDVSAEREDYQNMIKNYQESVAKIQKYQKENVRLESNSSLMKNEIQKLMTRIKDLTSKLELRTKELQEQQETRNSMEKNYQQEIEQLNAKLTFKNIEFNKFSHQLTETNKKMQILNGNLKEEQTALQDVLNQKTIEIHDQTEQINTLNNTIQGLTTEEQINNLNNLIKELKLKIVDRDKKIKCQTTEIQKGKEYIQEIQQNLESSKKSIKNLSIDLTNVKEKLTKSNENVKNKQSEVDKANKKLKEISTEYEDKIKKLNKDIDKLKSKKGKIKDQESLQTIKTQENQINSLKTQVSDLQKQLEILKSEKDQLLEQMKNDKNNSELIGQLKDKIEALKDEKAKLHGELIDQRRKIEAKDSELTKEQKCVKTLQDQLAQSREKISKVEKNNQVQKQKIMLCQDKAQEIYDILQNNTIMNETVLEHSLQCLSCLNPVNVPMTLQCGHSICKSCFEIHSDPKSKDSLVFCEECKMETKNKHLKEMKILNLISAKYKASTQNIKKIKAIVHEIQK